MGHEKINDVCVIGMLLEEEHTEVPRAYVVLAPDVERSDATAREIMDWQAKHVANHKKLRGGIRFVDEIPKSAAGKILRRLLKVKMDEEKKQLKAKL